MSAGFDCGCPCPDPTVTEIPGAAGEDGADGDNGVNAFTVLTADATIPAIGGNVTVDVGVSSWAGVGQVVFLSDGTDWGHFEVLSIPSSTSLTLEFLGYANDASPAAVIGTGGTVSPSGVATPLSAALPTALTDNTTGTASDTLAVGVGVMVVPIFVNLAQITGTTIFTHTPGFAFKVLSIDFSVEVAVTTAAKLATITPYIGGVTVTGGDLDLTSANCTPKGAVVTGDAITAANTGTSGQALTLVATSVTPFVEGSGWILLRIQNMDSANAFASLADHINDLITSLTP